MRLIGYCLLANHFHRLLWPRRDGDLSRWMQWLLTSHIRRTTAMNREAAMSGRAASRPSPFKTTPII